MRVREGPDASVFERYVYLIIFVIVIIEIKIVIQVAKIIQIEIIFIIIKARLGFAFIRPCFSLLSAVGEALIAGSVNNVFWRFHKFSTLSKLVVCYIFYKDKNTKFLNSNNKSDKIYFVA